MRFRLLCLQTSGGAFLHYSTHRAFRGEKNRLTSVIIYDNIVPRGDMYDRRNGRI